MLYDLWLDLKYGIKDVLLYKIAVPIYLYIKNRWKHFKITASEVEFGYVYEDPNTKIFEATFEALKNYIEVECASINIKYNVFGCGGIEQLKYWAEEIENRHKLISVEPKDSFKEECHATSIGYLKLIELYNWYVKERPKREYNIIRQNYHNFLNEMRNKYGEYKWCSIFDNPMSKDDKDVYLKVLFAHNELERQERKEDWEMYIELAKVVQYMHGT